MKYFGIFCIAVFTFILLSQTHTSFSYVRIEKKAIEQQIVPTQPKPITLTFVGDIMLDRGVAYSVKKHLDGDFSKLFAHIPLFGFDTSDILFANLEGPSSDIGTDMHNLYSFRMTTDAVTLLKNAGFDIVSFANNHVGDWRRPAFEDTLTRLRAGELLFTGAGMTKQEAETPTIIDIRGTKIGFLGFSDVGPDWLAANDTQSGILLANDPDYDGIIARAKAQVDVLIVSMHAGVEYQEHTARQTELAHRAIDSGATLFIGHHPHVAQATEEYKGGFIAYSLGNFIFDQYFSKETMQGLAVTVTLTDKKITDVRKQTVFLNSYFVPEKITEAK